MFWAAAALAIKAVSHVPVEHPQSIPYAAVSRTYAIVEQKSARSYAVDFAAVPDCNGAHVCSFAHVYGSLAPMPLGYTPSRVYAYCNDATLTWREGKYYYVTLKCGKLAQLQAMRKSMRRY